MIQNALSSTNKKNRHTHNSHTKMKNQFIQIFNMYLFYDILSFATIVMVKKLKSIVDLSKNWTKYAKPIALFEIQTKNGAPLVRTE